MHQVLAISICIISQANFTHMNTLCGDDVIHFLEPRLSTYMHFLQHINISHNTHQG